MEQVKKIPFDPTKNISTCPYHPVSMPQYLTKLNEKKRIRNCSFLSILPMHKMYYSFTEKTNNFLNENRYLNKNKM
jgi:hypothetical protein